MPSAPFSLGAVILLPREPSTLCMKEDTRTLLGGPWVVISGVMSRVTTVITHTRGLITPLITSHEPPSTRTLDPEP